MAATVNGHPIPMSQYRLLVNLGARQYAGQRGDCAASALLAHGVRLMGRSVKYRRVRGVLSAGPEEPNALLTVGTAPDVVRSVRNAAEALPAVQIKQFSVNLYLAGSQQASTLFLTPWPSTRNTCRRIPESCNRWCWT